MILSRRLLNQILAIFLPTIAIVIVCFSTNYWKVRITSQYKYVSELNRVATDMRETGALIFLVTMRMFEKVFLFFFGEIGS